jgi:alkylhydroperoxidase/carboxymuconolactone decarboxylase family protein YurZ
MAALTRRPGVVFFRAPPSTLPPLTISLLLQNPNRHFNAIATHLIATLKELGVKQQYIDEAIGVVATTKDAILKQGEYAGRK